MKNQVQIAFALGRISKTVEHRGFEDASEELLGLAKEVFMAKKGTTAQKAKIAQLHAELCSASALLMSEFTTACEKESRGLAFIEAIVATL